MAIWMLFGAMTALVVMAVLWPLSRRHWATTRADDADLTFYRDQLAEIDRDSNRGLLSSAEAEAARAEAGRRLLRATSASESGLVALGEPALRRRRAVSALAHAGERALPVGGGAVHIAGRRARSERAVWQRRDYVLARPGWPARHADDRRQR